MSPAETIERIHDKSSSKGFASLDSNERTVWLVASADFETNLGGASGYLYNSAGDQLQLLLSAFDAIECPNLSAVARNLLDALAAVCDPSDRNSRYDVLFDPAPAIAAAMHAFESAIQDCTDDYGTQLESFINSWQ